jgi:hypothetical protein
MMWGALSEEISYLWFTNTLLLGFNSSVSSGTSPAGLITIFYYLKFEASQTWRA